MDSRGRLAQPLKRSGPQNPAAPAVKVWGAQRIEDIERPYLEGSRRASRIADWVRRQVRFLSRVHPPRFAGLGATALLVAATLGYGVMKGGHISNVIDGLKSAPNALAIAAGFGIAEVSLSGESHVSRNEIFAAAGVNDRASLLFLDVDGSRARLKAIPWIADASVRKLFPDRLQITVTERDAFALWQHDGKVAVVASDGTVVGPLADRRFIALPFVVGEGAQTKAKEFLALLDRHPDIRDQVRASIYVAQRRWNLRLKNGIDVRLPENDVEQALTTLSDLDRDKRLLSRDIVAIDLRLPDRVTVQLSDEAAQAHDEATKDKKTKRKAGDA